MRRRTGRTRMRWTIWSWLWICISWIAVGSMFTLYQFLKTDNVSGRFFEKTGKNLIDAFSLLTGQGKCSDSSQTFFHQFNAPHIFLKWRWKFHSDPERCAYGCSRMVSSGRCAGQRVQREIGFVLDCAQIWNRGQLFRRISAQQNSATGTSKRNDHRPILSGINPGING